MNLNYIITETNVPDSFDPLLADKSNNITMMRMLYHTPIQINSSNELISNVLDRFEYNPRDFTINLFTKKNMGTFSDGAAINNTDVLMAILRVAYSMPNFPVIKDIIGVHEWSESKQGLTASPSGITLHDDRIQIKLIRHNPNALFRFSLELFSIIPSKCIDLKSGKLICSQPPYSGYYELGSKNSKEFKFKRREIQNNFAEKVQYQTISFQYKNFSEICKEKMNAYTIISANDVGFYSSGCSDHFKPEQIHWLQASRFGAVLFNPNVKPFNTKVARKFYANKIRDYLKKHAPNLIVSKSLFSRLLPGYLKDSNFPLEKNDISIEKNTNTFIADSGSSIGQLISEAIEQTSQELNIEHSKLIDATSNLTENFLNNKLGYNLSSSGFWPQDPIGDISMFFTKNLHLPLKFIWQDKKMYELIKLVEDETDPIKTKIAMENLNLHLYEESLIAPVVHFRRLYITHENIKSLNLPLAVTSPAPWHLIPSE